MGAAPRCCKNNVHACMRACMLEVRKHACTPPLPLLAPLGQGPPPPSSYGPHAAEAQCGAASAQGHRTLLHRAWAPLCYQQHPGAH